MAIGPSGEIIAARMIDGERAATVEMRAPSGEPGMLLAEFRSDVLKAARSAPEYLFRFRRPELYGPLARS
jgi:hypothetical protein